ncbi:hypothetical protein ACFE04_007027 [Oxalis oulophora]
MPTQTVRSIRFAVGVLGNIISFGLFLSPVKTFYTIYKKKSVEDFQPYPYLTTVIQCMIWVFYGLPYVTDNNTLVMTINGIGVVIELFYIAFFFYYDKQGKYRKLIAASLLGIVVVVAALIVVSMTAIHTRHTRAKTVGAIADGFNIIMYAAPLLIIMTVIRTKSVKYMPFWISLAVFVNSMVWTAYSLIIFDLYVLISNSAGTVLGIFQLTLYAIYYKSTPKEETPAVKYPGFEEKPAVKKPELELSQQPSDMV